MRERQRKGGRERGIEKHRHVDFATDSIYMYISVIGTWISRFVVRRFFANVRLRPRPRRGKRVCEMEKTGKLSNMTLVKFRGSIGRAKFKRRIDRQSHRPNLAGSGLRWEFEKDWIGRKSCVDVRSLPINGYSIVRRACRAHENFPTTAREMELRREYPREFLDARMSRSKDVGARGSFGSARG